MKKKITSPFLRMAVLLLALVLVADVCVPGFAVFAEDNTSTDGDGITIVEDGNTGDGSTPVGDNTSIDGEDAVVLNDEQNPETPANLEDGNQSEETPATPAENPDQTGETPADPEQTPVETPAESEENPEEQPVSCQEGCKGENCTLEDCTCACHLGNTSTDGEEKTDSVETPEEENPDEPEEEITKTPAEELYDRLMACTNAEEMDAILAEYSDAELDALMAELTEEQQIAIQEKYANEGGYDTDELRQDITYDKDSDTWTTQTITFKPNEYKKIVDVKVEGSPITWDNPTAKIEASATYKNASYGYNYYGRPTIKVTINLTNPQNIPNGTYELKVKYKFESDYGDFDRPGGYYWDGYYTETIRITFKGGTAGKLTMKIGDFHVAYDAVRPEATYIRGDTDGKPNNGDDAYGYNDSTQTKIVSVSLGGVSITQRNSNKQYGYSGEGQVGQKLSGIYSKTNQYEEVTYKTLSITPAAGYYVTDIVIACCNNSRGQSGTNTTPFGCSVWEKGGAFTHSFGVSNGGTVTIDIPSSAFVHGEASNWDNKNGKTQFFILIKVKPVPTPLFVEYQPGEIIDYLTETDRTLFTSDPDGWTSLSTGGTNNYGYNVSAPDTAYTQYRYAYKSETEMNDVENWKHYANVITNEAKQKAADAGYYFAGWRAEYNTECKAYQSSGATNGNNYIYDFCGSEYGVLNYAENQEVKLYSNVKLIAQWLPIAKKLKFVKNWQDENGAAVTGEATSTFPEVSFALTNGTQTDTAKVNYTGSWTTEKDLPTDWTVDGLTVIENIPDGYEKVGEVAKTTEVSGSTIYYIYTATNKAKPKTTTLTVSKTVNGNMCDTSKKFDFTASMTVDGQSKNFDGVTYVIYEGNTAGATQSVTTGTTELPFQLSHGQKIVFQNLPIGAVVTITESDQAYETTITGANETTGKTATVTLAADNNTVFFLNVLNLDTPDTGIALDMAPYVILLATVAVGFVLMAGKKRYV